VVFKREWMQILEICTHTDTISATYYFAEFIQWLGV
jgi:hypothetical protein